MAPNQESDDVFKLKFFCKMFSDYTKEFKVGVHKMTGTATSPVPEAMTPPQAGSGKPLPKSSSTMSSEPSSDVGSGENLKGSKEGSNEKIADAKEFAKQDDEEFENDGGAMAQSKIRNRHLQRSGSQSKDRENSPYMTARNKQSPYESRDLDQGIRKRRNSGIRRKKTAGDKSGKSGRSGWREANALKELTSIAMISYCELHDDEYINVSEELKKKISDMKTELQNEKK